MLWVIADVQVGVVHLNFDEPPHEKLSRGERRAGQHPQWLLPRVVWKCQGFVPEPLGRGRQVLQERSRWSMCAGFDCLVARVLAGVGRLGPAEPRPVQ